MLYFHDPFLVFVTSCQVELHFPFLHAYSILCLFYSSSDLFTEQNSVVLIVYLTLFQTLYK